MTNEEEVSKALCRTFVEIAEREKKKAIQNDDYSGALVISIFEGLFKEAEKSIQ